MARMNNASTNLRQVSDVLPSYLQNVFSFASFNRMQSQCLDTWYKDGNILISSPTGSGKTVCFELAIMRLLHSSLEPIQSKSLGSNRMDSKIVFIAPTKSLCAERAEDWRSKFSNFGLRVELVTGDIFTQPDDSKLLNADLIVTTAEKWDSVTRNIGSHNASSTTNRIALLLLDEVHQIGDSRGASLESVVTRMIVASDDARSTGGCPAPVAFLRIIAVSATISNACDIANWLRVHPSNLKSFDETFRPVPLHIKVLGYRAHNPWQIAKVYDAHMMAVIQKYSDGKPSLIFCPSRKQTVASANALAGKLRNGKLDVSANGNALTHPLSAEERRELSECAHKCSDKVLKLLIPLGIGVHHADMSADARALVEELFRKSMLRCLFATSTLAQGVNLPARLVIIAGTSVYHGGSLHDCEQNTLLQMCGRAGRTGLDTQGVAVIMTPASKTRHFEIMSKGVVGSLESQLESNLEECINAEIARQIITDIPSAVMFLTSTFFCSRLHANHQGDPEPDESGVRSKVIAIAMSVVDRLSNVNLVRYDDDCFGLESTSAGLCMAKYCISYETMGLLWRELPKAKSTLEMMKILGCCTEVVQGVCVRRSEKKRLNEINSIIRIPVYGKVKEPEQKVSVLLQAVMGDHVNLLGNDFSLHSEAIRLMKSASRVCSCIISLVLERSLRVSYDVASLALQVCRAVMNKCFWDGPTTLRQIPGVGKVYSSALSKHGISTVRKLGQCSYEDIENATGSKPPFGKKLHKKLEKFPLIQISSCCIVVCDEQRKKFGVKMELQISSQAGDALGQKGLEGFILVGSTSHGLVGCQTFSLEQGHQMVELDLKVREIGSCSDWKCVDVHIGPTSICGTDVHETLSMSGGGANGEGKFVVWENTQERMKRGRESTTEMEDKRKRYRNGKDSGLEMSGEELGKRGKSCGRSGSDVKNFEKLGGTKGKMKTSATVKGKYCWEAALSRTGMTQLNSEPTTKAEEKVGDVQSRDTKEESSGTESKKYDDIFRHLF